MLIPTPKVFNTYRPDIDGLRAIAIIAVVFNHAGFPGFYGGYVGVDVFFVISGFLITTLLFNELISTGRVSMSAFYARRVRRLMPAGLVVVAATLLFCALFLDPEDQLILARSAIAMAFSVSNFYFFETTGGYFDGLPFTLPLLHTWSLGVEEQYYLVWPLLMLLVFRFSGKPHVANIDVRIRVIWLLVSLFFVSLALCVSTTLNHHNFAFFLLPSRVWEFAIGGIIGLLGATFYARLRWCAEGLAVIGLSLIVYTVVFYRHSTVFPGWAAILPVLGSAALIVGMSANEHGIVRRLLALRPMVNIGLLSYSWYLWHWPLLSIYKYHNLGMQDVVANAVLLAVALALAWLTYIWIEHPVRMLRPWIFSKNRSTLFAGLGISMTIVLMVAGLLTWRHHQIASGESHRLPSKDRPLYSKICSLSTTEPVGDLPRKECSHGPGKEHPKVLLWGDSHADHMMQMLMTAVPDVAVYQLTMAGCVPVIGFDSVNGVSRCSEFNQRVLQEIFELKKSGLEAVVISARWPMYMLHQSISVADQSPGDTPADAQQISKARLDMQVNLEAMLSKIERAGLRVVVLAPTPELVYFAPQCLAINDNSYCNVPRAINDKFLGDTTAALEEVVSHHTNTKLVKLMDFFCDKETCYALRNGKILYFDDDHITVETSRDLGRFLKLDLAWLRGKPETSTESAQ